MPPVGPVGADGVAGFGAAEIVVGFALARVGGNDERAGGEFEAGIAEIVSQFCCPIMFLYRTSESSTSIYRLDFRPLAQLCQNML